MERLALAVTIDIQLLGLSRAGPGLAHKTYTTQTDKTEITCICMCLMSYEFIVLFIKFKFRQLQCDDTRLCKWWVLSFRAMTAMPVGVWCQGLEEGPGKNWWELKNICIIICMCAGSEAVRLTSQICSSRRIPPPAAASPVTRVK